MTRTGKALSVVFGLALLFAVSMGGQFIGYRLWWHAAAAYTVAALCLAGLVREVGRAIPPGYYSDDYEEHPDTVGEPYTPHTLTDRQAARAARRELRTLPCGCNTYWSSLGAAHDPWCHLYDRSSA